MRGTHAQDRDCHIALRRACWPVRHRRRIAARASGSTGPEPGGHQRRARAQGSGIGRAENFATLCEERCDRAGPTRLAIGNEVAVCFRSSADGYVTVWSINSKGGFDLIYPNKYSHPKTVAPRRLRRGPHDLHWRGSEVSAAPPAAGTSRVYLHWTRCEDEQLGLDDYPVIGKDTRASPPYASTTLQYEVVTGN